MVDQLLDAIDEAHRVGQARVQLKRRLVPPARMDVEEARVAGRAKGLDRKASRLLPRRRHDLAQRRGNVVLPPRSGVEAREDEELHRSPPLIICSAPRLECPRGEQVAGSKWSNALHFSTRRA